LARSNQVISKITAWSDLLDLLGAQNLMDGTVLNCFRIALLACDQHANSIALGGTSACCEIEITAQVPSVSGVSQA
jgi:hypothetical protein